MLNKNIEFLRKKANNLPLLPGVYIMKNAEKQIIYIGKAKKLKNRVSSYFRSLKNDYSKVAKMVEQIYDFDYIICDSEYEALVLECSLIKQNLPKYNILLKDDKGYSYLKITNDEWPAIKVVFQKDDKNAKYIGPFYSHYVIKSTLEEAIKTFKIPSCNKNFSNLKKNGRPCLNYHIGLCSAPCAGKIKKEEYLESINNAISFIKSGKNTTIKELTNLMKRASENLNFEAAAKYRDQINILKQSSEKQKVISSTDKDVDVISTAVVDKMVCVAVFIFKNYRLFDCRNYIFKDIENLPELRSDFLKQFYYENEIPSKILIDGEIEEVEVIKDFLNSIAGKNINLINPIKGKNYELIKMASLNAAEHLSKNIGIGTHETAALDELAKLLNLTTSPKRIEAYDISHTSGKNGVGCMVVFINGKASKKDYRKFNIKTANVGDDYASIYEVISRRLNEYENSTDESFSKLPDLILLDGGRGQLSAVYDLVNKYSIPIFGMVKDSKHKTRAIAASGGDISIKANKRAYSLVYKIQEEVHRFAINYHRSLNTKKGLLSDLLSIEGIGPKRAKLLLKHFKTIQNIKNSSVKELSKVVPEKNAEKIFKYFN